jgi:prolyl 4-hydroxylase
MRTQLPPAWASWLAQNAGRGCSAASLAEVLARHGLAETEARSLALAACEAAKAASESAAEASRPPAARPRPAVEGSFWRGSDGASARVAFAMEEPAPCVALLEDFLSEAECEALIGLAKREWTPAPVIGADGAPEAHAARTSSAFSLRPGHNELVRRVEARLAEFCRWPAERGEGLQLLRYEPGQEYRPHYDWFESPGSSEESQRRDLASARVGRFGQRVATALLYLSDVESGGSTIFPRIGLSVRPRRGALLYFANVTAAGERDTRTLHGGEPVVKGVKFVATKWMRERAWS